MTRPIYEPTPQRADAYLDFQQQQLFRRPAPTGGLPIAYAWISMQNNQTVAVTTDAISEVPNLGWMTDGYSSDPSMLWPDLATGVIWLSDSNFSHSSLAHQTPGYYIVHANVFGWDQWTGSGDAVCDANKGTGVIWNCSNLAGKEEVMSIYPACAAGCNLVADTESFFTDAAIVQAASNNSIYQIVAQCSGQDAAFSQADLYVALFQTYPTADGVYYTSTS